MIEKAVRQLVCYGLEKELFPAQDAPYVTNRVLEVMQMDTCDCNDDFHNVDLPQVLRILLDDAASRGLFEDGITARDLFDTKLMGALLPPPSVITEKFYEKYGRSPKEATDWYYRFSCDSNYIRRDRIAKDVKWVTATEYGDLDITINLSKPEKDPRAIAAAKNAAQSGYPKCQLCRESEGYAGRMNFPARQNHRIIPIRINGRDWFMQYSPYVYYNEHCIALNGEHSPMAINRDTFLKLLDFVKTFPHYFIGSNADLPIVGGSILSHDHFQGGHYTFAMEKAPIEHPLTFAGFPQVEAGIVKWPMSVIRLRADATEPLIELADSILAAWRGYSDEQAGIFAETDGTPHNTITPIARKNGEKFELDLVLRNNLTTDEHPLGVFHPHAELHHIKKENIGLIEVMGLAVLPSRLKNEMADLREAMLSGKDLTADEVLAKHADWAKDILARRSDWNAETADLILKEEIGKVFARVLEHAGVYKRTADGLAAFKRFAESV